MFQYYQIHNPRYTVTVAFELNIVILLLLMSLAKKILVGYGLHTLSITHIAGRSYLDF